MQKFSYDASDRLVKDVNDSTGVTFDFAYTAQNVVDKIKTTANKVWRKRGRSVTRVFAYSTNDNLIYK